VVKILIGVSLAGLVLSAAQLNFLCLVLSPLAIVLLWSYSYFKRFSASTHLFLGLVEACAPIGGWLAVSGRWAGEPFLLGLAIIFWIAGFDIIYSLLDYDFDRHNHLFSFAVKFGPQQALNYSFLFHLLTFFFLFMFALVLELSWIFKLGVILIGLLLVVEQYLARQQKVSQAFFTMNCLISLILFSFTLAEVVLRR
jgi:4-hydroxybenzoate polyprenyltransferase